MRMVVSGREGQIVRSLRERMAGTQFQLFPIGRPELDLAGDSVAIVAAIAASRPDIVVSAAAYTQVDRAESEPDLAFAVNEHGARAVAEAAARLAVPLIHLSTDYVFDGSKSAAYAEDDSTAPTSVYGASKLAGERAVLAEHDDSVILRTAWVYSPFGSNFMKTMLRLARDREEISVVADQYGNPTSALDIADAILAVAANLIGNGDASKRGIFHMTAKGEANWADFAEAIFAASAALGGPSARVKRIATADFQTAAKRPANSRLDSNKLERAHGVRMPEWRDSMKHIAARLLEPAE